MKGGGGGGLSRQANGGGGENDLFSGKCLYCHVEQKEYSFNDLETEMFACSRPLRNIQR